MSSFLAANKWIFTTAGGVAGTAIIAMLLAHGAVGGTTTITSTSYVTTTSQIPTTVVQNQVTTQTQTVASTTETQTVAQTTVTDTQSVTSTTTVIDPTTVTVTTTATVYGCPSGEDSHGSHLNCPPANQCGDNDNDIASFNIGPYNVHISHGCEGNLGDKSDGILTTSLLPLAPLGAMGFVFIRGQKNKDLQPFGQETKASQ